MKASRAKKMAWMSITAMLDWVKKSVSKARRNAAKIESVESLVTDQQIAKSIGMQRVPMRTSKNLQPKSLFPKTAIPAAMIALERNGCSRLQLSRYGPHFSPERRACAAGT